MRSVRTIRAAAAAIVMLGLCATASAQTVGERLVTLKIDFERQLYWIENSDGSIVTIQGRTQGAILREANDVFLPKGTVARLVVTKSNPLNYKYTSKQLELTDTSDFTAASNFAAALGALIKLLGSPSPVDAKLGGVTPLRNDSDVAVDVILRRNGIADVKALDAYLVKLDTAMSTLSGKTQLIDGLFSQAKEDQSEVRRTVCGDARRCTWDLPAVAETIDEGFKKLDRIHQDLAFDPNTRTHDVTVGLNQVLSHRDTALKALKTAKDFAAAVAKIDQDVLLPNEAPYLLSKNRPIEVTRSELKLDGSEVKPGAAKTDTFTFRPDSPVTYGFGPDYVYAFVRGSTFKAKKQGDQLVIDETPLPDYVGNKFGAVMSIMPSRWVNTPFTPFAEIGVNVTGLDKIKESAGILTGVGFSPYSLFTVGFGLLFQQVPALDGQKVGDVIAAESDIKTKFHFKQGWYFQASVTKKLGGS